MTTSLKSRQTGFRRRAVPQVLAMTIALTGLAAPLAAQDAAAGEAVFRQCAACHQIGEGARHRTGPALNGIVGAEAGQAEGFRYSPVLADSGIVWDAQSLIAYMQDPRGFLPGNRMAFAGLRSDGDAADVVAYLASFAADGTRQ